MVSVKPELSDADPPDAGFDPDEGAGNAAIRIILADSQTVYRVGVRKVFALEDDIRVIAQADTLAGLYGAIQRFPTDVVLLEENLISGAVDAIPDLVCRSPQLKIIVQSAQNDESNTVELYLRGVRGIIPRSISPDFLVKCVRKIAAGEIWIDNQAINRVIEAYRSLARTPPCLSPKELAIITASCGATATRRLLISSVPPSRSSRTTCTRFMTSSAFPIGWSLHSIVCIASFTRKHPAPRRR
jgi:DNA-binding NarL/FixJ family response regulator